MPLDSMLAENFHAAYRQKRSGVLTAEGATATMRFCFQDGSPIAIDLGDAKDRLLAYTLRSYNRLTEDQMADVLHHWEQGQAAVADLVVARTYASEEEVGRSTQAMVEVSLCRFFSSRVAQVSFDDQKTIDGFDFDRQAFRLKIDAEVLLRTVDARIAEIRTVEQEFGSFDAIFAFNEDSPGSGNLSEAEKRVLDHVDGKTPIHEIAKLFRDNEVNTARLLSVLGQKKIVRRLDGEVDSQVGAATGFRQAMGQAIAPDAGNSAARAAVAAAAMRAGTQTMREFTPYRQVVEEPRSRFMTVVLALVLALLCVIGVLVYQYQQKQKAFQETAQRLEDAIGKSQWAVARQQIDDARSKAGDDLSAVKQVDGLDVRLRKAIEDELAAITKLSADGDHAAAGNRLSVLPATEQVDALRTLVSRNQAASRQRAQELAERAGELLAKDDVAGAQTLIASWPIIAREKVTATDQLERWRVAQLELASSTTTPFAKRLATLAKLRSSQPDQRMLDQLPALDQDVKRQEQRLHEQFKALLARVGQGDLDGVTAEIDKSGLTQQVEGTPLADELTAIHTRIAETRATLQTLVKDATEALIALDKPAALVTAQATAQALTTSTIPGVGPRATATAALLGEVIQIPLEQTPDAQAAALQPLLEQRGLEAVFAEALHTRAERLRGLEGLATLALDAARAQARDGDLERAVAAVEALLAKPELAMTSARRTAATEIDELKARLARRDDLKGQLKAAIARGDVAAGTALARELGLKYLPLSVESLPSGAEVWRDGKQVGNTPLVLDITAAERVDCVFEIRVPGYQSGTAEGAKAEAGWRLLTKLERQPAVTSQLGGLVTNHPCVVGKQVIVASRSAAGTVDAAGAVTWLSFAKEAVDSPIYAPAVSLGDDLLLATRDQVALQITRPAGGPATCHRVPLAGRSDAGIAVHRSSLIVDRRFLIIAGLDGALHATDDRDVGATWKGPSGAPFRSGPKLLGDVVAAVRKDGVIERLQADDGSALAAEKLGSPVVAAWSTDKGLAGYTALEFFEYDGLNISRTALPQSAADGVADLIITPLNRVLVRSRTGDRTWDDVGRLEGRLSALPLVWKGHAVLPQGSSLVVYGPRGFHLTSKSEFLTSVVLGERLVVITQDGVVQQFDP